LPIYEFRCQSCGHTWEKLYPKANVHAAECPECQGYGERRVSVSNFSLKGTGWGKDNYGLKGNTKTE
jgi:putative FmdB family regulatory protein